MSRTVTRFDEFPLWVCPDCAYVIAVGEQEADMSDKKYKAICNEIDYLAKEPNFSHLDVTSEEEEFSTSECDCCGSRLAGGRTLVNLIVEIRWDVPTYSEVNLNVEVCDD